MCVLFSHSLFGCSLGYPVSCGGAAALSFKQLLVLNEMTPQSKSAVMLAQWTCLREAMKLLVSGKTNIFDSIRKEKDSRVELAKKDRTVSL